MEDYATAILAVLLFVIGFISIIVGLWWVYPPVAMVFTGVSLVFMAVRLPG